MRAQAFACVARYAPDEAIVELADEAFDAAGRVDDVSKSLIAAAWPIRALIERGHAEHAAAFLKRTLAHVTEITKPGSAAEALFSLLEATYAGGSDLWRPVVDEMIERCTDTHWRTIRALKATVRITAGADRPLAERVAALLEASVRDDVLEHLSPVEARAFFQ